MPRRGNLSTQFQPGVSGNPGGVPRGTIRIDVIIKRFLSQKESEWPKEKDASAGEVLAMAAIRNGKVEAAYFKEILNRNDGPVSVSVEGDDQPRVIIVNV